MMMATQASARLDVSDKPTRHGDVYFQLQYLGQEFGKQFPFAVWPNELEWVIGSLESLAARLDVSRFSKAGWYPLMHHLDGGGGLTWLLEITDGGQVALVLRRYADSFRPKGGEVETYTRFFTFSRYGRWPIQIKFPESMIKDGFLAEFARDRRAWFEGLIADIWEQALRLYPDLSLEPINKIFRRLSVRVATKSRTRRQLLIPGLELRTDLEPRWLASDAEWLVLSNATRERNAAELSAAMNHALDPEVVARMIGWTRRYDESTLREGFIFNPAAGGSVSTVNDNKIFASDPLLTALVPGELPTVAGPAEWVAAPQCKPSYFDAAQRKGWTTQVLQTRFGRVPLPTPERREMIRHFLVPPKALSKSRWRVLQLLDLYSSAAVNLPEVETAAAIVQLQRIALLYHDCALMFTDEPAALPVLQKAHRLYIAILRGAEGPEGRSDLPTKER